MITLSDTYNPNEIVKLKHLNELAAQLNAKIDNQRYPKPLPPFSINFYLWDDEQSKVVNKQYQLDNIPSTVTVDTRALTAQSGVPCLQIGTITAITNGYYSTEPRLPVLLNITTTGSTPVEVKNRSYSRANTEGFRTFYSFGDEAATITATLHVDESENYRAVNVPITFTVVPGGA